MTELPPIDQDAVAAFWQRCRDAGVVGPDASVPIADYFGDSVELADELLGLVLHGPKRATAAAVVEFELQNEPLPAIGSLWIACDGRGRPRTLIRSTDVRIGPLSTVDDAFAWDEGEGDRSRDSWLRDHTRYWQRALPAQGLVFDPEMQIVFERFEVAYSE